jgi:5-methylcytosine-specific restriction protein A
MPYARSSIDTSDQSSKHQSMNMDKNQDVKLAAFLRAKAAEAERAIRYRPNYFIGMLETDGGHLTVIKLLSANGVSEGFKKLWEHGRLDLSVEALVVESEWRTAFDPVLIARAEKRLNEVGYRFKRFAAT